MTTRAEEAEAGCRSDREGRRVSDIVIREDIPGGHRETAFDSSLRVVRVVNRYPSGDTDFAPPEVWASPEARAQAEAQLAAVDMPRRRKANR